MPQDIFNEPRLALSRIYTRGGDEGNTSLAGGQRVPKDDLRIEAYGTVDELNAFIGVARCTVNELKDRHADLAAFDLALLRIQHELFNLGSFLSTPPENVRPKQPRITDSDVLQLEEDMDRLTSALPQLQSFVLPGGSRLSAELHVCRTVCRRAERLVVALNRREPAPEEAVRYLNRLSDALFVWSRWVNQVLGEPEVLWQPNQSASGIRER